MVVPAKYTGRLVLMTAISVALAALALSEPWYTTELSEETLWGERTVRSDTFYIEYYQVHPSYWFDVYKYPDDSQVGKLMSWERAIVLVWVLVGILFVGVCLVDMRGLAVGFAILLLLVGMITILLFAGAMTLALTHDVSADLLRWDYSVPFIGSRETGDGYTVSGMPGIGFLLVLIAAFVQVAVGVVKIKIDVFDRMARPISK